MEAGWWVSPTMPAHYTREEQAGRGAVAKYDRKRRASSGMPRGDAEPQED